MDLFKSSTKRTWEGTGVYDPSMWLKRMDKGMGGDMKELGSCKDGVLRRFSGMEINMKERMKRSLCSFITRFKPFLQRMEKGKPILYTSGGLVTIQYSHFFVLIWKKKVFNPSFFFMLPVLTTSLVPRCLWGTDPAGSSCPRYLLGLPIKPLSSQVWSPVRIFVPPVAGKVGKLQPNS